MKNIIIILGSILTLGILIFNSSAIAEQRVKVFELAESGTPQEIAAEDAENDRLAALREAKLKKPKKRMQIFEMGESGQTVEFPMTPDAIAADDAENDRLTALQEAKQKKCVAEFELAESGVIIEFPVDVC
jgi:hypothetical protein